jgi:integrase
MARKKAKNGEGSLYQRNRIWWYSWTNGERGRRYTSTGCTKKADAEEWVAQNIGPIREFYSGPRPKHFGLTADGEVPQCSWDQLENLMIDKRIKDHALDPIKRDRAIAEAKKRFKNLDQFFGDMDAARISYNDIERYKSLRIEGAITSSDKPGSPGTINRELSALKAMLRRALKYKLIDSLPPIEMLREPSIQPKALSDEDTQRFLEYLEQNEEYRHLLGPVSFAVLTGWRVSQILHMKKSWINWKEETVTAPAHFTKNNEEHTIPLHPKLVELLTTIVNHAPPGCEYVFYCTRNKSINSPEDYRIKDFRGAWSAVCVALGLGYGYKLTREYTEKMEAQGLKPGPRFHWLRNTAVVMFLQKGIDPALAQQFTGHLTRSAFDRYTKLDINQKREVLKKLL